MFSLAEFIQAVQADPMAALRWAGWLLLALAIITVIDRMGQTR